MQKIKRIFTFKYWLLGGLNRLTVLIACSIFIWLGIECIIRSDLPAEGSIFLLPIGIFGLISGWSEINYREYKSPPVNIRDWKEANKTEYKIDRAFEEQA